MILRSRRARQGHVICQWSVKGGVKEEVRVDSWGSNIGDWKVVAPLFGSWTKCRWRWWFVLDICGLMLRGQVTSRYLGAWAWEGSRIRDRDLGIICPKEFFEAVGKVGMSRKLEQGGKPKAQPWGWFTLGTRGWLGRKSIGITRKVQSLSIEGRRNHTVIWSWTSQAHKYTVLFCDSHAAKTVQLRQLFH